MAQQYTKADNIQEIRIAPGKAIQSGGVKACGAGVETTIYTYAGKGEIIGGTIQVFDSGAQKQGIVGIYIDDDGIVGSSFEDLNNYGIIVPTKFPVRLTFYDIVNNIFAVDILSRISFQSELKITYTEQAAVGADVTYSIMHTATL